MEQLRVEGTEVPPLYCPFASRISPHAEAIDAANLAWLARMGLPAGPRIQRGRFGRLAARAYPEADLEPLGVAAAWATWLFLRDDRCDETGLSSDPTALHALGGEQIAALAGHRYHGHDPITCALAELRERMLALGGARWMARFLANVQDYFDANVWEAENRARGRVPDVATYIRLRDLTGAVRTCFDIFELVEGPLAIDLRCDPRLARLMCLANRAICWANDLFSLAKERAHGDVHNLVLAVQHETGATLAQALAKAVHLHDDAVFAFEQGERQLREEGAVCPEMVRFLEALRGWVRANLDWSIETGRYGAAGVTVSTG